MVFIILQVMFVSAYASPFITILFPILFYLGFALVSKVSIALRETARITNITKSPLLSFLAESISGASTIRAFGYTE